MCALSASCRSDVEEPVSDDPRGRRLTAGYPLCCTMQASEGRKKQLDLTQVTGVSKVLYTIYSILSDETGDQIQTPANSRGHH